MIVWLMTDMEGLAGVSLWDECYDPDDASPLYRHGREQLTAEVNAAAAGCFDAGATAVRVLDGHGRNRNQGFLLDRLDSRVTRVWIAREGPRRWEGLDERVHMVAMIGQHAMAGTLGAFLDHTQCPKEICRYTLNGQEHGEMSQLALYAGAFGVPLAYVSGDESLCDEARRLFPHALSTPTKRGTGWATCELYDPVRVRAQIRRDVAAAVRQADRQHAWRLPAPIEVGVEYAWSALADRLARTPGVRRVHARVVRWRIADAKDVFTWPGSAGWRPIM